MYCAYSGISMIGCIERDDLITACFKYFGINEIKVPSVTGPNTESAKASKPKRNRNTGNDKDSASSVHIETSKYEYNHEPRKPSKSYVDSADLCSTDRVRKESTKAPYADSGTKDKVNEPSVPNIFDTPINPFSTEYQPSSRVNVQVTRPVNANAFVICKFANRSSYIVVAYYGLYIFIATEKLKALEEKVLGNYKAVKSEHKANHAAIKEINNDATAANQTLKVKQPDIGLFDRLETLVSNNADPSELGNVDYLQDSDDSMDEYLIPAAARFKVGELKTHPGFDILNNNTTAIHSSNVSQKNPVQVVITSPVKHVHSFINQNIQHNMNEDTDEEEDDGDIFDSPFVIPAAPNRAPTAPISEPKLVFGIAQRMTGLTSEEDDDEDDGIMTNDEEDEGLSAEEEDPVNPYQSLDKSMYEYETVEGMFHRNEVSNVRQSTDKVYPEANYSNLSHQVGDNGNDSDSCSDEDVLGVVMLQTMQKDTIATPAVVTNMHSPITTAWPSSNRMR